MKGRWRLSDLLAVTAGELLANGLDHLPLTRRRLQRLCHVLAEFAQTAAATAGARLWRFNQHALAREMLGKRIPLGPLAREAADRRPGDRLFRREFVFRGARLQLY
jgi:hypothetical protein